MRHVCLLACVFLACVPSPSHADEPLNELERFFALFSSTVTHAGTPEGFDPSVLGPKVLMAGDSNVGTSVSAEIARLSALRDKPWRFLAHSVSGSGLQNETYWKPHMRALCATEQPALLILNLGANDAGSQTFGARWTEFPTLARDIAAECEGAKLIVVGIPPDYAPLGVMLQGQALWLNLFALPYAAGELGGVFVPVDSGWTLGGFDGVHYSEGGGRALGGRIYEAARLLLGEVQP